MTETFLNGRVQARQPDSGFRSGTDAVMLAAAIPAQAGEAVLELGAGAGVASLCLAARVPGLAITGVEIDKDLVDLACANAAASGASACFTAADIFALPPGLRRDFDQVFCNPPFHGEGVVSPDPARARALADSGAFIQWMRIGLQRTVSGGYFTTIFRADRLGDAMAVLGGQGTSLFPLWSHAGTAAKRIIVQARKGSRAPLVLLPGLVLHGTDGCYTPQAEAVLRDGGSLATESARL